MILNRVYVFDCHSLDFINEMASMGLRTLCLAYRHFDTFDVGDEDMDEGGKCAGSTLVQFLPLDLCRG